MLPARRMCCGLDCRSTEVRSGGRRTMGGGGQTGAMEETEAGAVDAHGGLVVLDYGSQYTQLIARRARECQVASVLLPGDAPLVRPPAPAPAPAPPRPAAHSGPEAPDGPLVWCGEEGWARRRRTPPARRPGGRGPPAPPPPPSRAREGGEAKGPPRQGGALAPPPGAGRRAGRAGAPPRRASPSEPARRAPAAPPARARAAPGPPARGVRSEKEKNASASRQARAPANSGGNRPHPAD